MTRGLVEKGVVYFSWLTGVVLLASVVTLIGYLILQGGGSLRLPVIFAETAPLDALLLRRQVFDGLFPAIIGTILLVLGAMCIAIPVGICGGIYMAEYCHDKIKAVLNLAFDILAGIPSIVVGLAGLLFTIQLGRIFPVKIYPCLLISCCALAMLILPYLIRTTQTALEATPPLIRTTAPALGATRLQNITRVLLPNALSDIVSGIILAGGRCAEDTAVIMLTGVVATAGIPHSLLGQFEALPFYIYYISSQYTGPDELARGYAAAIILLLLCIGMILVALSLQKRISSLLLYR